jgi:hypothetical protein
MSMCSIQNEAAESISCNDRPCQQTAKSNNRIRQSCIKRVSRCGCLQTKFNKQKVMSLRRQIQNGDYDFDGKFDIAMDRVLELLLE